MKKKTNLAAMPVAAALAGLLALAGCAVGPEYARPAAPVPALYKEAPVEAGGASWLPAAPADALDRGAWWTLFGDAELSSLVEQVAVSNQNVAAAVAAYAQARALVGEQRAARFPALGLDASARRSGALRGAAAGTNAFDLGVSGNWVPDVWGRLGRGIEGAEASAQASAADLAAATLAAQGELATAYFSLRGADAEAALLRRSIEGFERSLQIARNRYAAGVVARTDVLQAETQLANTRAELAALVGQRQRDEHAIAVLAGRAPGDFSIADTAASAAAPNEQLPQGRRAAPASPAVAPTTAMQAARTPAVGEAASPSASSEQPAPLVPVVPLGVPSALLERRPDIAAAERSVAAFNAQIGIARSAYFPSLALSGSVGASGSRVGDLFSASSALWSLGVSVAQTLFDAGATRARVAGAEAARDAAVARYRQTVLAAFQDVEDRLSTLRALAEQDGLRRAASAAADATEAQIMNRYRAGQVGYTEVVTAQQSALSARRTIAQLNASRQAGAVALIQALGGGWQGAVR